MHWPLAEQRVWAVVQGYFAYHAVPTNFRSLTAFLWKVRWLWLRNLRRRSQKDGTTWKRFDRVTAVRLPKPKILHPWPQDRFAVKHPRWKPGAVVPHAGFCAGGAG
jgi:RNA-directed DNA polymerase